MRFQKGHSGNRAGKPKGAKDKRTELRALLQPHAEALVQKAARSRAGRRYHGAAHLCGSAHVSSAKRRRMASRLARVAR
jgi:hypothetical protein